MQKVLLQDPTEARQFIPDPPRQHEQPGRGAQRTGGSKGQLMDPEPGKDTSWHNHGSEDIEIRTNAGLYLPQISDLLNRVPRQMLLLLKTNDLLRGIETTLQTRASSSSFINMSRCCIRAIARHKRTKAQSRRRRVQITLAESLSLWKLYMYELFLWLKGSMTILMPLLHWDIFGCQPCF